jgi:alpha-L-rhamnosidase
VDAVICANICTNDEGLRLFSSSGYFPVFPLFSINGYLAGKFMTMLKHIFILSLSFLLFNAHAQDIHQSADMTAEQLNAPTGPVAEQLNAPDVSTGGQISVPDGPSGWQTKSPAGGQLNVSTGPPAVQLYSPNGPTTEQMKAPVADQLRAPDGLTVEHLRAPEQAVITDPFPEFGWIFPAEGRVQGSYRVLVASAPFLLKEGVADLWDSGIVPENRSVNVSHGGSPLGPQSTCWWQVKVWSEDGRESAWSAPQQFNVAVYGSDIRVLQSGDEQVRPGTASHSSQIERAGSGAGQHLEEKRNVAGPPASGQRIGTGSIQPVEKFSHENHWVELGTGNWVSRDVQRAGFHTIEPELLVRDADGPIFADFGKSAFGILEFTATAHWDDVSLVIHFGERRGEDPTVHKHRGISNITYEVVEVMLKEGMHHYRVEFPERPPSNYLHSQNLAPHYPEVIPFRYVEIEGNREDYHLNEIRQSALFYYFDDAASRFHSSYDRLNDVWELCKYTLKATPFLGIYADGNRERMPYEADAYIQQLGHYAVDREYAISRHTIAFLLEHASWPTEWQMHVVMMAWEYYMQTGDWEFLAAHYEGLRRKTLVGLTDDNGLISTRTGKMTRALLDSINLPARASLRDIVDWPQGPPEGQVPRSNQSPVKGGETDEFVFTDYNAVVNAFHNHALVLMGRIAGVVGDTADQAFFAGRAERHKKAFYQAFFDEERGLFTDGIGTGHASLHANMFPLAFGLVRADHVPSVTQFIISRGMACSVYGAQYLLEALYNGGAPGHALELMVAEGKRGWLNMIRAGSSMTTEAWDEYYKPNLTWNHAWGTAPANIIPRKLFGIEPLEPAYARFRIAPQPGLLEVAEVELPTLRGPVFCRISNEADRMELEVSVPGNSEAELWLPSGYRTIVLNGRRVQADRQTEYSQTPHNIFLLGSGKHRVTAKGHSL